MAKEEKAGSDKRGWFARWRERRAQSRLRASGIALREHDARSNDVERAARYGRGVRGP
jgi:hypothetical protein